MGGVTFTGNAGGQSASHVEPPVSSVAAAPVCVAGQTHRAADCPDLDDDSDHVLNKVDACPTQAEDADGYLDADGCPDPDNDGDGVLDEKDACPKEAGPSDHQGCAVKDADQDGIEDADDQCPKEPGDKVHQGCPAPVDTDGDGVADAEDNCVKVAGSKTNQGCPEKQKQLVVIRKEELKILDKVYFSVGGSRLQRRSFRLLNQVAEVLKGHPDLPVLEVQGHTDSTGKPANNLRLSQRRADAVRAYLIKRGIPAERLSAKGYGPDRPVESNETPEGREANRRVEFRFAPAASTP
jgi:outer membrane protein OmpA-like peptidoglycan-associated protein